MKKIVTILLAVVLIASMVISPSALYSLYTPDGFEFYTEDALQEYIEDWGVEPTVYHYYFQMPNGSNGPVATKDVYFTETDEETGDSHDVLVCRAGEHAPSWYNEYTTGAGIYWYGPIEEILYGPEGWCGYRCEVVDEEQCIYRATVPAGAMTILFNNGVDGGLDKNEPIYYKAAQSSNTTVQDIWEGDFDTILDKATGSDLVIAPSNDGLIFIVNPDKVTVQPDNHKMTCVLNRYYYYGDGCYGMYSSSNENFNKESFCVNPDHDHSSTGGDPEPGTDPEPTAVRGDYDGDTEVTIMDATYVQKMVVELIAKPADADLKKIDADGDEILTIIDATRIRNVVAALINMDGTPVAS